jgi:uncharacterized protein (TIGR03790 family)
VSGRASHSARFFEGTTVAHLPVTVLCRRILISLTGAGLLLVATSGRAAAQTAANVLVVTNDRSSTSTAIAAEYVRQRAVPQDNVCHISAPLVETVSLAEYQGLIAQPIWNCIAHNHAQDRILYIVLTKDIPIRIAGTSGRDGTVSSVDSELTLLYRVATGHPTKMAGPVPNPYFARDSTPTVFTHARYDIFLVTRLDGYTLDDVRGLIARGAAPQKNGKIVLDERSSWTDPGGNSWLHLTAAELSGHGLADRVLLDESAKVITHVDGVLGYYSWGSNDPAIRIRDFGMKFLPGALAAEFVSSDARTFKEPPVSWHPGGDSDPAAQFAGTPQSLIGDFIRAGVTGTAGHVNEPYLDATIRPDILFPAYLSGANLAEAFYAAMPYLSWQTVVIGDPLCAPLRPKAFPEDQIDPGIDPDMLLPKFFAERRMTTAGTRVRAAAAAFVRAEALAEAKDKSGTFKALGDAIGADPHFTGARMALALAADSEGRFDDAIVQYRGILEYDSTNWLALNNLAYSLAVNNHAAAEALPLAQDAVDLTKSSNAATLDTLAWVQHLLGQDADALPSITGAIKGSPDDADVRYHAAEIYAALKDPAHAASELATALKLNPQLAGRDDVKALQKHLDGGV